MVKKRSIKSIPYLCLLLLVISMLGGCLSANRTDNGAAASGSSVLEPAVLTFHMVGEEKKDTREVLDDIAEASKLNVRLDFIWSSYSDYFSRVKTAFAANNSFDAFLCGGPEQGAFDVIDMYKKGLIKDITELLPRYAPEVYRQLDEQGLLKVSGMNGRYIFVPSLYPSVSVLGIYVRRDLAEKYGVSSIGSLEDYTSLMETIKENESDILTGFIAGGRNYDLSFYANASGYAILEPSLSLVYKWDDPDMKIVPWERTPEFKETTRLVGSWFEKGLIRESPTPGKEFASFICKTGNLIEDTYMVDLFSDGNSKPYNLYILNKNEKSQRGGPLSDNTIGDVAFNSKSANTERALMFLDWIQSSQENYDLFNYGIEGRHYILQGDRIRMPSGVTMDSNPYWQHHLDNQLLNYAFMNADFHRLSIGDTKPDGYMDDYADFVKSHTRFAPHEGFFPDLEGLQPESDERIKIYTEKITDAFEARRFDTNETDKIIYSLESAGTSLIVQKIQEQLAYWRSINMK